MNDFHEIVKRAYSFQPMGTFFLTGPLHLDISDAVRCLLGILSHNNARIQNLALNPNLASYSSNIKEIRGFLKSPILNKHAH